MGDNTCEGTYCTRKPKYILVISQKKPRIHTCNEYCEKDDCRKIWDVRACQIFYTDLKKDKSIKIHEITIIKRKIKTRKSGVK